jgi:hypothetical protein
MQRREGLGDVAQFIKWIRSILRMPNLMTRWLDSD